MYLGRGEHSRGSRHLELLRGRLQLLRHCSNRNGLRSHQLSERSDALGLRGDSTLHNFGSGRDDLGLFVRHLYDKGIYLRIDGRDLLKECTYVRTQALCAVPPSAERTDPSLL